MANIPLSMKKFIFLLIVLNFKSVLCQNINTLDVKYGISKFKLGSPLSDHISNLTYNFKLGNLTNYTYNKKDINRILSNVVITEITLMFYKNKLYNISIYFPDEFNNKVNMLQDLNILFGKPTDEFYNQRFNKDIYYYWKYQWESKKTLMSYEHSESSVKGNTISLFIYSKIIDAQKINDQF